MRRVPLSKTRTLRVHVYVYVYVDCTCIRSVQLSESGTLLVQYTSRTPNHPLVYQPPKVYPPPGSEGVRAPSRIFTEGLSFHSGASGRGMYAFLIWCTVHVPYTKRRSSGRAVYRCSAGLPLPPNVHTHTYTQTYTNIHTHSLSRWSHHSLPQALFSFPAVTSLPPRSPPPQPR